MIELKTVSTIYEGEKTPSLNQVNLKVEKGEFIVIKGPNGAGKTTLLETINGLLHFKGEITVFGMDLKKCTTTIRKRIGYVPQDFAVDVTTPFLVKDVVLMGRFGRIGLLKSPVKADYAIANKMMNLFSVYSLRNMPVGKLSGGQFQKVLLARALTAEPDILLLDEPFSNLDAKSCSTVSETLSSLNRKGLTILMVVHNQPTPPPCNRVITIEQGKIVADQVLS